MTGSHDNGIVTSNDIVNDRGMPLVTSLQEELAATRHSFASQLVNSNVSLFKASKLLGHSSVKMTEKYSHSNIENLKTDIQKLSLLQKATVTRLSPEALLTEKNL